MSGNVTVLCFVQQNFKICSYCLWAYIDNISMNFMSRRAV